MSYLASELTRQVCLAEAKAPHFASETDKHCPSPSTARFLFAARFHRIEPKEKQNKKPPDWVVFVLAPPAGLEPATS